ncbi:MAG: hypothetical protein IT328_13615 [Caldilineaceae bacterium]|nr:hypothetical protein [Caldilineaceae bacterium]
MKKLRWMSLCTTAGAFLGALLWVCLSAGVAQAQSEEGANVPFCGELSEAECVTLAATSEVMAGLTSGTSEHLIEVYFTGGALGEHKLSLSISSESTFVAEEKTLTRMAELRSMTPEALMASPAAATEAMLLPLSIDVAETNTVAFSPELLAMLSERFGAKLPATFSYHSSIVNDVMYIRPADFAVFGAQPAWMPEWLGIRMIGIISETMASTVTSPDFDVTDAQSELEAPGAAFSSGVVYHVPPEQVAAYADFMHLTSVGSRALDGQLVNVYSLTWDVPRYVGGPLFAQQMGLLSANGELGPASRLLGILGTVLLDGLHAETTQSVGVEDSYLYAVETRAEWALGLPGGGPVAERPVIGYSSSTINRDLNAVTSIPAPTGAMVLPLDQLLNMIKLLQQ